MLSFLIRSFATVYKAQHLGSKYELAIKIIDIDDGESEQLIDEINILKVLILFHNLSNTSQKCQHDNIVSYFGSNTTAIQLCVGVKLYFW